MNELNKQVFRLDDIASDMSGKVSTFDKHSGRAYYPVACVIDELGLEILVDVPTHVVNG
jgi:hypothetical protein